MLIIVSIVPEPEEMLSKYHMEGKERKEGGKEGGREDGNVDGLERRTDGWRDGRMDGWRGGGMVGRTSGRVYVGRSLVRVLNEEGTRSAQHETGCLRQQSSDLRNRSPEAG